MSASRLRASNWTLVLLTIIIFRQVSKSNCKNNLENHSFGTRLTTATPTSSTSNWSTSLDKNNTNAYSYGHTYYYSPSAYGQTSKPASKTSNNKYNFQFSTTTLPSTSPTYSHQVSSPVGFYVYDKKRTSTNSDAKNKVTFPSNNEQDNSAKRSGSGTVYYKQDKDSDNDGYKQGDVEYEYDEDHYQPSKWYRDPYYGNRKRIQHKISSSKYEDSEDGDGTDKADYETNRPSASRDKATYAETPWRYGGNKYGGHGYYEDRHGGWQSAYPYDFEKMQSYHSSKDGYGGPLAFLLGLLPLGLLMAAMVPNVVPVAAAAAAAGKRRRSILDKPSLQYPVLESIAKFGVTNLDDPKCLQRIFCTVTRDGRTSKSNIVQKAFYRVVSVVNENWVEKMGLKDLFRAVRRNQCENIVCPKLDKKGQVSSVTKINGTRVPKMRKRRNIFFKNLN